MPAHFILVHSPLVGPDTWTPVAEALRRQGRAGLVPELPAAHDPGRPYWAQQSEAVARQVRAAAPADDPVVLVGTAARARCCPPSRRRWGGR